MSLEIWAVSLSFASLVGIVGFVTNETVKRIEKLREKRKALDRLSSARQRLASE